MLYAGINLYRRALCLNFCTSRRGLENNGRRDKEWERWRSKAVQWTEKNKCSRVNAVLSFFIRTIRHFINRGRPSTITPVSKVYCALKRVIFRIYQYWNHWLLFWSIVNVSIFQPYISFFIQYNGCLLKLSRKLCYIDFIWNN